MRMRNTKLSIFNDQASMRMITPRKIRLEGNVAQIGLMCNTCTILEAIWEDRELN